MVNDNQKYIIELFSLIIGVFLILVGVFYENVGTWQLVIVIAGITLLLRGIFAMIQLVTSTNEIDRSLTEEYQFAKKWKTRIGLVGLVSVILIPVIFLFDHLLIKLTVITIVIGTGIFSLALWYEQIQLKNELE